MQAPSRPVRPKPAPKPENPFSLKALEPVSLDVFKLHELRPAYWNDHVNGIFIEIMKALSANFIPDLDRLKTFFLDLSQQGDYKPSLGEAKKAIMERSIPFDFNEASAFVKEHKNDIDVLFFAMTMAEHDKCQVDETAMYKMFRQDDYKKRRTFSTTAFHKGFQYMIWVENSSEDARDVLTGEKKGLYMVGRPTEDFVARHCDHNLEKYQRHLSSTLGYLALKPGALPKEDSKHPSRRLTMEWLAGMGIEMLDPGAYDAESESTCSEESMKDPSP